MATKRARPPSPPANSVPPGWERFAAALGNPVVSHLSVRPGDLLVITLPGALSVEEVSDIRDGVRQKLPIGVDVTAFNTCAQHPPTFTVIRYEAAP